MPIPPIIHQTWKDRQVPTVLQPLVRSWRSRHPNWEYRLWTDEDNRNFIRNDFPDFLPRYDAYPLQIQRVDAVRYFLLYRFGGLYIDLDFECLRPFDELIGKSDCLFGLEPEAHCNIHDRKIIVGNALMGAVPGHPFIARITHELTECEPFHEDRNTSVLDSTGPFMLTRVYARDRPSDVTLLPSRDLYPFSLDDLTRTANDGLSEGDRLKLREAYAVHYFCGTWWRPEAGIQALPNWGKAAG